MVGGIVFHKHNLIFLLFLIWKNMILYWEKRHGIGKKDMVLGKKEAIFNWEWGRNSLPREGQKIPCLNNPFFLLCRNLDKCQSLLGRCYVCTHRRAGV